MEPDRSHATARAARAAPEPLFDRLAAWLDARELLVMGVLLGGLLAALLASAHWSPLWYDEIFTYELARLPSVGAIWSALCDGLDQQPFSFFLLHRLASSVLGPGTVATRAPEIAGFVLLSACLFRFVAVRTSAAFGALAVGCCWATRAFEFAIDARPYALVAGFCAAALVCWQAYCERPRSRWLVALALALAAAVASHYFAVLFLVPLGLAELVRSLRRRALDLGVWAALTCALLPIAAFSPIIRAAAKLRSEFHQKPYPSFPIAFYGWLFEPATLAVAALLLGAGLGLLAAHRSEPRAPARRAPAVHEVAAALGIALMPVMALGLSLVTNAITYRYVLATVLGFSILAALAAHRALGHRPALGWAAALLVLGAFGWGEYRELRRQRDESGRLADVRVPAAAFAPELPLVFQDPLFFVEVAHNAPREVTAPWRYLADPAEQRRYAQFTTSTIDKGLLQFARVVPLRIEEAGPFLAAHPRFLLYVQANATGFGWLLQKLAKEGARLEAHLGDRGDVVYLVDRRGGS